MTEETKGGGDGVKMRRGRRRRRRRVGRGKTAPLCNRRGRGAQLLAVSRRTAGRRKG